MPRLKPKEVLAAKELIRKLRGDYCHLGERRLKAALSPNCRGISGRTHRKKTGRDLILNHKDHNPNNNPVDGGNWELACNSCNTLDRPRSKNRFSAIGISPYRSRGNAKRDLLNSATNRHISLRDKEKSTLQREREREREREANRSNEYARAYDSPLLLDRKRYKTKHKRFRKWVENKIINHGSSSYEDIVNSGAEVFDVDQQTTTRWIKRMISSAGQYTTLPGKDSSGEDISLLVFKPEYQHKVIDKTRIPKLPAITPDYIQEPNRQT
jgi:hypothetical protein